jgi:heme a synthase
MRRLDAFQRCALLTTAATYGLIAVGGLVRATGAGLGCPDWPKCFGLWIPPMSAADVPPHIDPALFNVAKAWTEYVNRLLGVADGLLIFATLILAILHYRRVPRILASTVAAFVLVGIEGWIGGRVVASKLSPIVLTVHLSLALVIVSLLLYASVAAFFPGGRRHLELPRERVLLGRTAIAVSIAMLAQIGLGAAVRGEVQLAGTAGLARDQWLLSAGALFALHKAFAAIPALGVLALALWTHRKIERDVWLRAVANIAVALTLAQVLAGAGLVAFVVPPVLQVLHLWIGTLALGTLTVLVLLAYRLDPRDAETAPADQSSALTHARSAGRTAAC